MSRALPRARFLRAVIYSLVALTMHAFARDSNVVVSSTADPAYTEKKFNGDKPRAESYVVMQGHFFEGDTVDGSIDKMPFRKIAEIFAPELARQQYWPAKNSKEADLLIVVHWGVITPKASMLELTARTSPVADTTAADQDASIRMQNPAAVAASIEIANEGQRLRDFNALEQLTDSMGDDLSRANAAKLLGYTKAFRKYSNDISPSAEEIALRSDLMQERYFIILKAYNLHAATPEARKRSIWTLHLNMGSPGNNFRVALDSMSIAAANYVGRTTDVPTTIPPKVRDGKVEIGTPVIVSATK